MSEKKELTVYEKLQQAVDALPKSAIEVAKKEITRKGYDTTGYQYQFLVNVLNEVIGLGNWGFDYKLLKEIEGKWTNGKAYFDLTVDVEVWIIADTKKCSFKCIGGHKAEMYADALKGAVTNGFKKTIAFFGIGKKAYEGTIDEDYRPIPQEKVKPEQKKEIQLSMAAAEFLNAFEIVGDLKALQDYAGQVKDQIAKLPAQEKKYLQEQYILIAKKYNGGKV